MKTNFFSGKKFTQINKQCILPQFKFQGGCFITAPRDIERESAILFDHTVNVVSREARDIAYIYNLRN